MNTQIHTTITDIEKTQWNTLIGDNNPFLEYEFLKALETSKSIGKKTNWNVHYITAKKQKNIVGAIPLYLKFDSLGEYIFDWYWVSLYKQAGIAYFPKLVVAIPFTPATGNRILIHPKEDFKSVANILISRVLKLARQKNISSIHWLFTTKKEQDLLVEHSHIPRYTHQFHWHNNNYQSFNNFLEDFNAKKRNQIKRERKRANTEVTIDILEGNQITSQHIKQMYAFYLQNISRKWAFAYLTESFFDYIWQNFRDNTVLIMAQKSKKYIAGALYFKKNSHLYGRYWGAIEKHPCLHFELCYYRAIEYAIVNKMKLFEAGAQGEHKISRGLLPDYTYSAHWISHPLFANIIRSYLSEEAKDLKRAIKEYDEFSPFKT